MLQVVAGKLGKARVVLLNVSRLHPNNTGHVALMSADRLKNALCTESLIHQLAKNACGGLSRPHRGQ